MRHEIVLSCVLGLLASVACGIGTADGDAPDASTGGAAGSSGSAASGGNSASGGASGTSGSGAGDAGGASGADASDATVGDAPGDAPTEASDAPTEASGDALVDAEDAAVYEPVPVPGSRCNAVVQRRRDEGATHVAECSPLGFVSNPPSSGSHYPRWPVFGVYDEVLPRGYWVHALEHGAIVVTYSCGAGCASDVTAAKSFFAALPPDPVCVVQGYAKPRAVLTPDPKLDARFAASAWGHTLRADCFELEVFRDFYEAHIGQGPEQVCSDGYELRDGGVLALPPGCGD